jgi:cobalt-zinc-cadmium efflux system protein
MNNRNSRGTQTDAHGFNAQARDHVRRLRLTLVFTGIIFVAEVAGAAFTQSLALFVDAGHMLTDVSVLVASLTAAVLMQRKPDSRHTWGWRRLEVITAAGGALVLLFVGLYSLVQAVLRLTGSVADTVNDPVMLLVFGIVGLLANAASIVTLASSHGDNMNVRAAFLEVCNDALGSVAVVVSSTVLLCTGWDGFDAIAGGVIALLIVPRALKLLRDSVRVLLEEAPAGVDAASVVTHLSGVEGVVAIHDVHVSAVSSDLVRLTAHVVVDAHMTVGQSAELIRRLTTCAAEHFPVSIEHCTFQLEPADYEDECESHLDM